VSLNDNTRIQRYFASLKFEDDNECKISEDIISDQGKPLKCDLVFVRKNQLT